MLPQAFALRPVELCDLPTLKRWRGLPEVQRHLRHPRTSWWGHLRWWWRIQHDPTCRVWAVTVEDVLVGQVGWYYRHGSVAEVSVLVMDGPREDWAAERAVVAGPLAQRAKQAGLTTFFAEVLTMAPLYRHHAVSLGPVIASDAKSTIYRWNIP